jgi:hypothetical protein
MENIAQLILAGIALEAFMQILRNIWEAPIRQTWNFTRLALTLLALTTSIFFSDWNLAQVSGLDFGNLIVGKIITGLMVARVTMWVHTLYTKTAN